MDGKRIWLHISYYILNKRGRRWKSSILNIPNIHKSKIKILKEGKIWMKF